MKQEAVKVINVLNNISDKERSEIITQKMEKIINIMFQKETTKT